MKTVIWKLKAGNMEGQETAEQKRLSGYDYIEKIAEHEKVLNVVDEGDHLKIYLEENE